MTRATRTLSIVGAIVILGGIGLSLAGSVAGSGAPLRGRLAPLDSSYTISWTEVARLASEDIGRGRIHALDLVGDTLLVLQANAWSLVVAGERVGTYGSAVTGAPDYLSRGEGIVLTSRGIAILDAPRHRISLWSVAGERVEDLDLPQRAGEVALHQGLTATASGYLLTSWISGDSGGHWLIRRVSDRGVDSLPRRAGLRSGESFNVPHLLSRSDSAVIAVDAESWKIRQYSPQLVLRDSGERTDAPHFPASAPLTRRMRERVAMMPELQRRDFLITESLPSVRSATLTATGDILVLTVRDEESTIAELVATDGRPIAALWAAPDSNPIFALRGNLLRVRELDDVTVIERLQLSRHD